MKRSSCIFVVFGVWSGLLTTNQAKANDGSLPPAISALIEARYPDAQYEGARKLNSELFARSNSAFEKAWGEYEKRKATVDGALKSGRAALTAVVTDLKDLGQESTLKRQSLEATDAEYPAIEALFQSLNAKTFDAKLFSKVVEQSFARRKVSADKEKERMLWFAFRNRRSLDNLTTGAPANAAVSEALKAAETIGETSQKNASSIWEDRASRGAARAAFYDKTHKAGEWISIQLLNPKASGNTVSHELHQTINVRYACKDTNQIESISSISGRVIYKQQCKTRPEHVDQALSAKLVDTAPAWTSQNLTNLWVVGKVVSWGKKVSLDQAAVPDLRTLTGSSGWLPTEFERVNEEGKVVLEQPQR